METHQLLETFEDLLARAIRAADDREAHDLFRQAGQLALAFEPPRPASGGSGA
ncbi:MAG: hypothetical protein GVY13_01570 [Alphaproteobacteria bacterium]|jgi:hypothetical protein|nr:hypothetical protein [Alphaproteobacteria bacterium]